MGGVNLVLHPDTCAMFQKAGEIGWILTRHAASAFPFVTCGQDALYPPGCNHRHVLLNSNPLSRPLTAVGMLSPEGRCKTLDASADGYVRAEACGTFVLAASSDADPGGPRMPPFICLLSGSAVNQDGRSSSLTAPNGPAQQEVMRAALAGIGSSTASGGQRSGLSPWDVTALSMHGTGTPLGDPIEVGAVAAVLVGTAGDAMRGGGGSSVEASASPLTLLSSKSWFGHAEPAAGEHHKSLTMFELKLFF